MEKLLVGNETKVDLVRPRGRVLEIETPEEEAKKLIEEAVKRLEKKSDEVEN